MIDRLLVNLIKKSKKSVLLLGPRQTGKSTLISQLLPDLTINLADEATFLEFSANPREIHERITEKVKTVFVDEVQRIPSLLNTIQVILDKSNPPLFFLTGSSARKLKRGKANLLPGRILSYELAPLTSEELNFQVNLTSALETGFLPGVYLEEDKSLREKILKTYASTYLKEEIQAESLVRNIGGFSRFLQISAIASGQTLDFSKLASEVNLTRPVVLKFFEILEDTMIVHRCDSFSKSDRKRLVQHPKFYFFDTGVLNGVLKNFTSSADRIGNLFEHLLFNQIISTAKSHDTDIRVSTYRTANGSEVDFIVETKNKVYAIELKASRNIGKSDTRGLKSFQKFYGKNSELIIAYLGDVEKRIEDIEILPWIEVLKLIFS